MKGQIEIIELTYWEDEKDTLWITFNGHREPLPEAEEKEECAPSRKPTGSLLFLALLFFFLLLLCLGV